MAFFVRTDNDTTLTVFGGTPQSSDYAYVDFRGLTSYVGHNRDHAQNGQFRDYDTATGLAQTTRLDASTLRDVGLHLEVSHFDTHVAAQPTRDMAEILGSRQSDFIVYNGGTDRSGDGVVIETGRGNDYVATLGESSTVVLGDWDDYAVVDYGTHWIDGGDGIDRVELLMLNSSVSELTKVDATTWVYSQTRYDGFDTHVTLVDVEFLMVYDDETGGQWVWLGDMELTPDLARPGAEIDLSGSIFDGTDPPIIAKDISGFGEFDWSDMDLPDAREDFAASPRQHVEMDTIPMVTPAALELPWITPELPMVDEMIWN